MKKIEVLKLKYIPIIEIKKQKEKPIPKNKLTKENQDYIKRNIWFWFLRTLNFNFLMYINKKWI